MSRNQVNEDATQTCSHGLHVANWDYAHNVYSAGSDAVMLEVEVNPADVVAVPVDYNQAKMRVCKYKVLGVVTQPHEDGVNLRVTDPENYDLDEEEEEEEDEACPHCESVYCVNDECLDDCCAECGSEDCYGECTEDRYPYEDELR